MSSPTQTLYYIPHTHWEGAVFQTREAYLEIGLPIILRALRLLEKHPTYRFTLDQVCYVRPFLESYPEEVGTFRRMVDEGRLDIVGGTDSMLDVNMPGGESFARQVQYGKRYFRDALGVDVRTGWQLDTFGHHAQMPQLLRLAGLDTFWFARGVPSRQTPGILDWEGIDGSRVRAFYLMYSYAVGYGSQAETFSDFVNSRVEMLGRFYPQDLLCAPAGADVCDPEEHITDTVATYNAGGTPTRVVIATPREFEEAAADLEGVPVLKADLNPIFQGIYSSRIGLKQATRNLEYLLTSAEALGALLTPVGHGPNPNELWPAWEPMLFNQAHDLMSGVMTDRVHDDTLAQYDHSRRLATAAVEERFQAYVEHIDTDGSGIPVVVINTGNARGSDLVTVQVGFSDPCVKGAEVLDQSGNVVPSQIIRATRSGDGGLVHAEIAFVASGIGAAGHAVYHVVSTTAADCGAQAAAPVAGLVAETDRYRLTMDACGAMASLVEKRTDREVLAGPGNVIVCEDDHGDLWEPYKPLDGGSNVAMTDRHPLAAPDASLWSNANPAEVTIAAGPVYTEVTAAGPLGPNGWSTVIRIYNQLDRVEIRTTILNTQRFVRYRASFPVSDAGAITREIPYGAIEQPEGIEFPAQNWFSTGRLAVLNRGLPGCNVVDGNMLVSLARSTNIVAYGFGGGYGPGMSSDSGFEEGKELTFEYALLPHDGDYRTAGIVPAAAAYNRPLIARTARRRGGHLPPSGSLFAVSDPSVVITSVKQADDGRIIIRMYESHGRQAQNVELLFRLRLQNAEVVDLLEEPLAPLTCRRTSLPESEEPGYALRMDFGPYEIKTVAVRALA